MNDFVVPFGKYQGYPIEVLFKDKSYLSWFLCESDAILNYPDVHREIIRRFILNENSKPTYNNLKQHQFENPFIERNRLIADFVNPNFDWNSFISKNFRHEVKGKVSNLKFFNSNITIQLDYQNDDVENFKPVHINLDVQVDINDDFQYILNKLIKIDSQNSDSQTILVVHMVSSSGFSEEDLINIFQTNNINLIILTPKPKSSGIRTFGTKVHSNEPDINYPF